MGTKKSLGERLSMLAVSSGKTQISIAEQVGIPVSHLNKFFNGHSTMTSDLLVEVLSELNIDLEKLVSERTKKHAQLDENEIETPSDCLKFLYESLDDLGKQTYLSNLALAAKYNSKEKFPRSVTEILKKEINLI